MAKVLTTTATQTPLVHSRINKTKVNPDSVEGMTTETDKMVMGTFVNVERPGQEARISCKLYKNQELFSHTFFDNEKATIPLSVARHINEKCIYSQDHDYLLDANGKHVKGAKKIPRYKFIIESYVT